MGPCFLATLPALQAPLLLSHHPFPIPRCYYCCSPIASDCCRCVLSPELEKQCSSPLASTVMAHRTLKRNSRCSNFLKSGDNTVPFSSYLGPAHNKETPTCSLLSGLCSKFPLNQPPPSSFSHSPLTHANACLPAGAL